MPCYYLILLLNNSIIKMKGKLIVVEGTDGSGKTVQTNLLVERLLSEGHKVRMTDFPQYGKSFFANMIEKYLKGGFGWPQALRDHFKTYPLTTDKEADSERTESVESRPDEVNPYLTSLLYAGDRWETGSLMHKWLDDGDIIISNRYACSNMAHQGAKIGNAEERKNSSNGLRNLNIRFMPFPSQTLQFTCTFQ